MTYGIPIIIQKGEADNHCVMQYLTGNKGPVQALGDYNRNEMSKTLSGKAGFKVGTFDCPVYKVQ